MSKLQYALHMPPPGSIITPALAASTADLNKILAVRAQQEVVLANQILKQDPSVSRTDALMRASSLLDHADDSSVYEEPNGPAVRERMRG